MWYVHILNFILFNKYAKFRFTIFFDQIHMRPDLYIIQPDLISIPSDNSGAGNWSDSGVNCKVNSDLVKVVTMIVLQAKKTRILIIQWRQWL